MWSVTERRSQSWNTARSKAGTPKHPSMGFWTARVPRLATDQRIQPTGFRRARKVSRETHRPSPTTHVHRQTLRVARLSRPGAVPGRARCSPKRALQPRTMGKFQLLGKAECNIDCGGHRRGFTGVKPSARRSCCPSNRLGAENSTPWRGGKMTTWREKATTNKTSKVGRREQQQRTPGRLP